MFTIEIRGEKTLSLEVSKQTYEEILTYARNEGEGYERTIEGIITRHHDAHYQTKEYNLTFE